MKTLSILLISLTLLTADSQTIFLDNPYTYQYKSKKYIYARNIWDMQFFNGKIYLGAGNSSNIGPAQNAGRVHVVSLDPITDKFNNEYTVAEEQIDKFKVYGDTLYIPGHDATEKWTFGNIYTKRNDNWSKYRSLPNVLHVYDLVVKDRKIFTAIGLNGKGAVFVSDMNAKDWDKISHGKGRVYSFLEVDDKLFATKTFQNKNPKKLSVTQWQSEYQSFSSRYDLNVHKMFPDTNLKKDSIKIIRPVKFENKALYIGAYKHNDHQNIPFGLYQASFVNNKLEIKKIEIRKEFVPRDILVREKNIYILVTKKEQSKNNISVLKFNNNNFLTYKEIISFSYSSFARSFEEFEGCFYFGMGSDIKSSKNWSIKELKPQTGDIVKACGF